MSRPLAQTLGSYVDHLRAIKTANSAQNDIYDLREPNFIMALALCSYNHPVCAWFNMIAHLQARIPVANSNSSVPATQKKSEIPS